MHVQSRWAANLNLSVLFFFFEVLAAVAVVIASALYL